MSKCFSVLMMSCSLLITADWNRMCLVFGDILHLTYFSIRKQIPHTLISCLATLSICDISLVAYTNSKCMSVVIECTDVYK